MATIISIMVVIPFAGLLYFLAALAWTGLNDKKFAILIGVFATIILITGFLPDNIQHIYTQANVSKPLW